MRPDSRRLARLFLLATLCGACRPPSPVAEPARPLPDIPVYEITPGAPREIARVPQPARDPFAASAATRFVTLHAADADVRTLLLWLAQQAGISMVVAPDVTARVSVTFTDVPAVDAIRAVMAEAGLSVLTAGARSPWPPVVFRDEPVNVNAASPDAIVARFGVSREMANWIVESRPRP